MRKVSLLACCLVMCSLSLQGHAAVLAGWDVDGADVKDGTGISTNIPPYAFSATTSAVEHVQSVLTLGAGVAPSTRAGTYGFKIAADDQTNSLAGAVAMEHYLEFSITVDQGYELNLSSIEMIGEGTSTGCSNVVLMSSVDGFSVGKEMGSVYPANVSYSLDTKKGAFGEATDLSANKYQHLRGTVSFRVYGWNSAAGSGAIRIRNLLGLDLVIHGEVAIAPVTEEKPRILISHANGGADVSVLFGGASETNCCLQYSPQLSNSNEWIMVAGPFLHSTNLFVETNEDSGFYRVISEVGGG